MEAIYAQFHNGASLKYWGGTTSCASIAIKMTGDEIESLKRIALAKIGTAKIALDNLHYPRYGDHTRLQNDSNVARLFKNFQNDSCRRESPENHIKAAISSAVLQNALQRSRCSQADLQSIDPPFLVLGQNETVTCFEGQHRLAAASLFFSSETPDDRWWTVILYNDNGKSRATIGVRA